MKALFVNPNWKELVSKKEKLVNRPWPPLDLLNYAATFPESEILDLRAKNRPLEYINNKIRESDTVYITSSPMDRWQCPNLGIDDFVQFINSLVDKEKIHLLGVLPLLYPEKLLQKTKVKGIVKALAEGPLPAYEKIDLDNYHYELMGGRFAILETARGCPYQCSFCLKIMYGDKVIKKDIQKVKEEIDLLVKLGAKNIYFIDLELTIEKERVRAIANYIIEKEYKFNWCCQTRADAIDRELLALMKSSGCKLIHFGIESGSQRVLDSTNKKISIQKIRLGIKLTKEAGIKTAGFFMFGFPGETKQEMEQTIEFAKELDVDYASFHAVIPYPGTKITKAPDESVSKLVKKAYINFYFRPIRIISALLRPKLLFNQVKLFYNFIR
ncbi:MAG: radical SAM protein [Candidatus Margulisiibacteriota bacterium]|nr:radical SAM protein [Candidatus Margulisiibacteriota bacterium]